MLKAYYFVCEKYSQPQERGGEKGRKKDEKEEFFPKKEFQ